MRRCRHSPDVRPWEIPQQNWKVLAVHTDEISFGPAHDRQLTAENLTVEAANGVGYAYRRFGNTGTASPPLVFLQHFRGNLDNWDPCLVDEIAVEREVILFDNAGVGLSSGAVPNTVSQMARDAIAFLDVLELGQVDLLGYSLGGMVAQELALFRPRTVQRVVLAGTGPRGGKQMHGWILDIEETALRSDVGLDDVLHIFFDITETSRTLGREYVNRIFTRSENRDAPTGPEVVRAQYDAIVEWGIPDASQLSRLAGIRQPVLVTNGDNDRMIPSVNSQILVDHLPNARLRIFPDAAHGFLFQYPKEFAELVNGFLAG
jgi:pimeloyl-ACP methyl ester carboxylesterase